MAGDTIPCDECATFMAKACRFCANCGIELNVDDTLLLDMASKIHQKYTNAAGSKFGGVISETMYTLSKPGETDVRYNQLVSPLPSPLYALIDYRLARISSTDRAIGKPVFTSCNISKDQIEILNRRKSASMLFTITFGLFEIGDDVNQWTLQTLWFSHEEVAKYIPIFSGETWFGYSNSRKKHDNIYLLRCIATFHNAYMLYAQQAALGAEQSIISN